MSRLKWPWVRRVLGLTLGVVLLATAGANQTQAAGKIAKLDVSQVVDVSTAEWEFALSWNEDRRPLGPRTITVAWADGYQESIEPSVYQGGHVLYRTSNHLGACVSEGTAAVYNGWAGDFTVTQGPCAGSTRRLRYAALGDSYSSGEGNSPFDIGTDNANNMCHRSSQAWPRKLDDSVSSVKLVGHFACSGAVAVNVTDYGRWYLPDNLSQVAQLDAITATGLAPDLVTMTIGGNDFLFSDLLTNCVVADCVKNGAIRNIRSYVESPTFSTTVHDTYQTVSDHMAPNSRLVAVGYPNILNANAKNARVHCPWLSAEENRQLVALAKEVDGLLTDPSVSWYSSVSAYDVLQGHELCTAKPWVYTLGVTGGNLRGHPTSAGQSAIAARVMSYLHMAT